MAAKHAKTEKVRLPMESGKIEFLKEWCLHALNSGDGLHWREVELAVQNIMDYYAADIRAEELLKRGMERLRDIKRNVSFRAENAHELARSLEVRSMMDNAEMVLQASLERRESRRFPVGFCRADFPEQDDKNWLCFVAVKLENGEFKVSRIPLTH